MLLNTQYVLGIHTLRYLKVGISERSEMRLREGQKWEPQTQSSACFSPSGCDSSEGVGSSPHWANQTIGAEVKIRPGWLVHNEAEPRVRNKEVVQRVVAFHKPPSQDKESSRHGNPPPQPLRACLAAKSSLNRL